MKPLLILADDMTGAADTAALCCRAGLPVTIHLQPPRPPLAEGATTFTSDSRHLPPAAAAQRVSEMVTPLRACDVHWYKKIDSTLRGNLGSELDALLDQLETTTAIVCPAFPAQGRGLRDGYLIAPSLSPISIHLPSLLQEQSWRQVESIALAHVRAGTLVERLRLIHDQEIPILVIDAMEDSDLQQILAAVEISMPNALLCGSAGLVGALTYKESGLQVSEPSNSTSPADGLVKSGLLAMRTLLVIGSGSNTAHRQINALARQKAEIILLDIDTSLPMQKKRYDSSGPVWLLHLPRPTPGAVLDGPQARQVAKQLGEAALALIKHLQPTLLILSGGDTAAIILAQLGIEHLAVRAELLAGVPLLSGTPNGGRPLNVIMKPGSFGDDQALVTLIERAAAFLSSLSG